MDWSCVHGDHAVAASKVQIVIDGLARDGIVSMAITAVAASKVVVQVLIPSVLFCVHGGLPWLHQRR